jgi:hypothetical protein
VLLNAGQVQVRLRLLESGGFGKDEMKTVADLQFQLPVAADESRAVVAAATQV